MTNPLKPFKKTSLKDLEYRHIQGNKYPIFQCKRINKASIAFTCPKCGRNNIHGWPRGEKNYGGHRTSHCQCWPQGYLIELEETT